MCIDSTGKVGTAAWVCHSLSIILFKKINTLLKGDLFWKTLTKTIFPGKMYRKHK
jgi:hypothetical protein